MVAPNRQCVVRQHLIVVSLVPGKSEASVTIRPPDGARARPHAPRTVSIEPLLKGGLSEADALAKVMELVAIGVEGQEIGNA